MCSRITGHQGSGTGGVPQPAGSELPPVWVGTTSVPSGPSASSSAATTACAPPTTQPSAESDECTSSTPPGRTPSARRSAAISGRVTGAPLAAIARSSPLIPAWCQPRRCHDRGVGGRVRPVQAVRTCVLAAATAALLALAAAGAGRVRARAGRARARRRRQPERGRRPRRDRPRRLGHRRGADRLLRAAARRARVRARPATAGARRARGPAGDPAPRRRTALLFVVAGRDDLDDDPDESVWAFTSADGVAWSGPVPIGVGIGGGSTRRC